MSKVEAKRVGAKAVITRAVSIPDPELEELVQKLKKSYLSLTVEGEGSDTLVIKWDEEHDI